MFAYSFVFISLSFPSSDNNNQLIHKVKNHLNLTYNNQYPLECSFITSDNLSVSIGLANYAICCLCNIILARTYTLNFRINVKRELVVPRNTSMVFVCCCFKSL